MFYEIKEHVITCNNINIHFRVIAGAVIASGF